MMIILDVPTSPARVYPIFLISIPLPSQANKIDYKNHFAHQ